MGGIMKQLFFFLAFLVCFTLSFSFSDINAAPNIGSSGFQTESYQTDSTDDYTEVWILIDNFLCVYVYGIDG